MRCQFCGWDNPQGKETCEKCNKPLTSNVVEETRIVASCDANQNRPTDRQVAGTFNPKATVREVPIAKNSNIIENNECPDCGHSLEDGECPNCGYKIENTSALAPVKVAEEARKTMRPIRKGEKADEFKLVPISDKTGMPEGDELTYEGNEVILNRDNTDSKNTTITSQEQACLSFENGKWCIEDRSEYKTTFVQASRKIELQQGDLILLGNQLFRFEQ